MPQPLPCSPLSFHCSIHCSFITSRMFCPWNLTLTFNVLGCGLLDIWVGIYNFDYWPKAWSTFTGLSIVTLCTYISYVSTMTVPIPLSIFTAAWKEIICQAHPWQECWLAMHVRSWATVVCLPHLEETGDHLHHRSLRMFGGGKYLFSYPKSWILAVPSLYWPCTKNSHINSNGRLSWQYMHHCFVRGRSNLLRIFHRCVGQIPGTIHSRLQHYRRIRHTFSPSSWGLATPAYGKYPSMFLEPFTTVWCQRTWVRCMTLTSNVPTCICT